MTIRLLFALAILFSLKSHAKHRQSECHMWKGSIQTQWTAECSTPFGCTAGKLSGNGGLLDHATTRYTTMNVGPTPDDPTMSTFIVYLGKLEITTRRGQKIVVEDRGIFNKNTGRITSQEDRVTMDEDARKQVKTLVTTGRAVDDTGFSSLVIAEICED